MRLMPVAMAWRGKLNRMASAAPASGAVDRLDASTMLVCFVSVGWEVGRFWYWYYAIRWCMDFSFRPLQYFLALSLLSFGIGSRTRRARPPRYMKESLDLIRLKLFSAGARWIAYNEPKYLYLPIVGRV